MLPRAIHALSTAGHGGAAAARAALSRALHPAHHPGGGPARGHLLQPRCMAVGCLTHMAVGCWLHMAADCRPHMAADCLTHMRCSLALPVVLGSVLLVYWVHVHTATPTRQPPCPVDETPLRGRPEVFASVGFNRWTHGGESQPMQLLPDAVAGQGGQPAGAVKWLRSCACMPSGRNMPACQCQHYAPLRSLLSPCCREEWGAAAECGNPF